MKGIKLLKQKSHQKSLKQNQGHHHLSVLGQVHIQGQGQFPDLDLPHGHGQNLIERKEGKGDLGQIQGHIQNLDQDHILSPNRGLGHILEQEMEQVQSHPHPCLCQGHQPPPDTAVGRPTLYPEANPDQGQCLGHPSLLLMSLGDAKGKQEGLHWKRSTLEKQPVWQRRVWWAQTLERLRGEASKKGDNY